MHTLRSEVLETTGVSDSIQYLTSCNSQNWLLGSSFKDSACRFWFYLQQEFANHGLWTKSSPWPRFVNKILLECTVPIFSYCLCLHLHYKKKIMTVNILPTKPKIFTIHNVYYLQVLIVKCLLILGLLYFLASALLIEISHFPKA